MRKLIIGLDPGTHCGVATLDTEAREFIHIETLKLHTAQELIKEYHRSGQLLLVRVEDARKRVWYGNAGRERLQGAGSIKRDCAIWEDFLNFHKIPFQLVTPVRNATKLDKKTFTKLTGWTKRCSQHGRDAAGLLFRYFL